MKITKLTWNRRWNKLKKLGILGSKTQRMKIKNKKGDTKSKRETRSWRNQLEEGLRGEAIFVVVRGRLGIRNKYWMNRRSLFTRSLRDPSLYPVQRSFSLFTISVLIFRSFSVSPSFLSNLDIYMYIDYPTQKSLISIALTRSRHFE